MDLQGGYLVAHYDSEAHYQQPVLMIQLRSESALSFGYKAGGWGHLNEVHTAGCLYACQSIMVLTPIEAPQHICLTKIDMQPPSE